MQPSVHRGSGRPRAVRSADTRVRILRVARDVVSELGYDATTFQDIATRADLTWLAINHYFAGKRVLYQEVMGKAGNLVTAAIDRARREPILIGQLASFTESMAQPAAGTRRPKKR